MSKSRVCAERTIKLAQQTCTRKTNLLVYEKEKEQEGKQGCKPQQPNPYVPPISCPQAKRIKICTGAELKKMCPPPPCPCPPPPRRGPGLLARLGRLLGFGAKSLIALGAIYVTYDMGIWGDSESTGQIYKSMCDAILPRLVEPLPERPAKGACKEESQLFTMQGRDPYCCDKFPVDHESRVFELQQKWNKIVSGSFNGLAGFPARVGNWSHQIYCNMVDSESCRDAQGEGEDEEECPAS